MHANYIDLFFFLAMKITRANYTFAREFDKNCLIDEDSVPLPVRSVRSRRARCSPPGH